jgi:hypothetical protein
LARKRREDYFSRKTVKLREGHPSLM